MMNTTNSGCGVVQLDDRQGPVGQNEKVIIIAASEDRVAERLRELVAPHICRPYVLRRAETEREFDTLVQTPGMVMAFIEIGFFGKAMIGCLDRLHKRYPKLKIIMFTVSNIQPNEAARYMHWSGGGFISLLDDPEWLEGQLKALFDGRYRLIEIMLQSINDYDRLSDIEPHLTHQEIEVIRCMAREMTIRETAYCLKISIKTVNNHFNNIYRKFGIHNIVGLLKLAVIYGILPEDELRSCRFRAKKVFA